MSEAGDVEYSLHLHDSAKETTLDWVWQLTQLQELRLSCTHQMHLGGSLTRLSPAYRTSRCWFSRECLAHLDPLGRLALNALSVYHNLT